MAAPKPGFEVRPATWDGPFTFRFLEKDCLDHPFEYLEFTDGTSLLVTYVDTLDIPFYQADHLRAFKDITKGTNPAMWSLDDVDIPTEEFVAKLERHLAGYTLATPDDGARRQAN